MLDEDEEELDVDNPEDLDWEEEDDPYKDNVERPQRYLLQDIGREEE